MKSRFTRLVSMLLLMSLALACFAFAEDDVQVMPVEEAVEEVDFDLANAGFDLQLDGTGVFAAEDEAEGQAVDDPTLAPEDTLSPEEPEAPSTVAEPTEAPTAEPTLEPTPSPTPEPTPRGPAFFSDPLKAETIKLTKKSTGKTVKLGLPYKIKVKGETVKSCSSGDKKVAKVSDKGVLALVTTGKAKITVKTKSGKKYTLSLTVKDVPAPTSLKVAAAKKSFKLSWKKAERATCYLVEASEDDGESWAVFGYTKKLKLDVTDAVGGAVLLRVRAVLGDRLGGATKAVQLLGPVTDAKVFMEESFKYGPTDHMNITWTASLGATSYQVWRASLPSTKYKLIGTTKETWFADTLAPTKLYSYKIRPVWNGIEDTPFCKPVNLWTGMQDNVLPASDKTSSTGIILLVNKRAQVVTAYIKDKKGKYTLPLRHMICSSGLNYDRTRNGTYTIQGHKGEWYTYPGPSGDTIRWPSVYRSGYYFHSPLYNKDHTIRQYTVKRLGDRASAGCVRLKSNDAEWVYRNCPNGTTVVIVDGEKKNDLKEALKPRTVAVKGF